MAEQDHAPQRIVLTGATGFIGTHLQHQLLASGHEVVAVVRPGSSRRANIFRGVELRAIAFNDATALRPLLENADTVVHCAGAVRGRNLESFRPANIEALENLVSAALAHKIAPRFILISSLAASRPQVSDYALSKHTGEQVLRNAEGLQWVILRPPAVYGPGDTEMRPLFQSIRRGLALVIGPQMQRLSMLYVSDLATAVAATVIHHRVCAGQAFEIDDGHVDGYTWPEIIAAARSAMPVLRLPVPRLVLSILARVNIFFAGLIGYQPMLTPGKVRELSQPSWLCDNHTFSALTNWQPRVQLKDGVRATQKNAGRT